MEIQTDQLPNSKRLSEIAGQAKATEQNSGFMEPGQKVKGKPGRPRKEEAAKKAQDQKAEALKKSQTGQPGLGPQQGPQAQTIPSSEMVKPVVALISNAAVAYVEDPRAAMKPEELESAAMGLGMLVDKYMPTAMAKYGPEILCLMVFGQYGIRVVAMKKYLAIQKSKPENLGPDKPEPVVNNEKEKVVEIFPQEQKHSWEKDPRN